MSEDEFKDKLDVKTFDTLNTTAMQNQFDELKLCCSVKTTETETATPDGCRINELEERVALLQSVKTAETQNAIAEVVTAFATFEERKICDLQKRVEELAKASADAVLHAQVGAAAVSTLHSELQEKADDLQGATTVMEGRICELHAKVDELQSDLDKDTLGNKLI